MSDFSVLHSEMSSKGFTNTITGSDGNEYYLPKATYYFSSSSEKSTVLKKCQEAVAKTGKRAEIIVADCNSCTWSGLNIVK